MGEEVAVLVDRAALNRRIGPQLGQCRLEARSAVDGTLWLPVVLMSGYTSNELMSRALVAPCGILRKPFAPEALIDEVRRCLAPAA